MVMVWPLAPLQKKVANPWFGSLFLNSEIKAQANRPLTNFETLILNLPDAIGDLISRLLWNKQIALKLVEQRMTWGKDSQQSRGE